MFMMGTIVLSSVSFVVQTIPYYYYDEANVFQTLETLCVIFFTIEYTLRFVCSPLPGEGPEREQSDVSEQIDGAPRSKPAATAFVIVQSRIKFMMGYMNIIDLLAIFPFYLEVVLTASNNGVPPAETTGIAFVRVIRITRVFRLLKLGKHNDGMQILLLTLEESSTFLTSVLFLVLIIQVLFGAVMFFMESGEACHIQYSCIGGISAGKDCTGLRFHDNTSAPFSGSKAEMHMLEIAGLNTTWMLVPTASYADNTCGEASLCESLGNYCFRKDGQISKFNSIPAAMWWTLVTMCCVGFGDMAPLDEWGKMVGAVTAITGVIVLAMPTTVIGTNFSEIYEAYYEKKAEEAGGEGDDDVVDEIQGANSKHLNRLIVSKQLAAKAKTEGMPEDMIEKALHHEQRDEVGAKQIIASLNAFSKEIEAPDTWKEVRLRVSSTSTTLVSQLVSSYYQPRDGAESHVDPPAG